jgi:hypothetical protein
VPDSRTSQSVSSSLRDCMIAAARNMIIALRRQTASHAVLRLGRSLVGLVEVLPIGHHGTLVDTTSKSLSRRRAEQRGRIPPLTQVENIVYKAVTALILRPCDNEPWIVIRIAIAAIP